MHYLLGSVNYWVGSRSARYIGMQNYLIRIPKRPPYWSTGQKKLLCTFTFRGICVLSRCHVPDLHLPISGGKNIYWFFFFASIRPTCLVILKIVRCNACQWQIIIITYARLVSGLLNRNCFKFVPSGVNGKKKWIDDKWNDLKWLKRKVFVLDTWVKVIAIC